MLRDDEIAVINHMFEQNGTISRPEVLNILTATTTDHDVARARRHVISKKYDAWVSWRKRNLQPGEVCPPGYFNKIDEEGRRVRVWVRGTEEDFRRHLDSADQLGDHINQLDKQIIGTITHLKQLADLCCTVFGDEAISLFQNVSREEDGSYTTLFDMADDGEYPDDDTEDSSDEDSDDGDELVAAEGP